MSDITIDDVIQCHALPTLPAIAIQVLELTQCADTDFRKIGQTVQNDAALTTRILRTVNSSFYGLSKPCPTISRALTYLGMNTVRALVLGFSMVDMTRSVPGFDFGRFWRQSMYSAAAARRLAAAHRCCDPDEAFTLALIQDIGMLAIHASLPRNYGEMTLELADHHDRLPRAERAAFSFDHAMVGGRLAEMWRFPPSFIEGIMHHHDLKATGHLEVIRTAHLSAEIVTAVDQPDPFSILASIRTRCREWFSIDAGAIRDVLSRVQTDGTQLSQLLNVRFDRSVDVSRILHAAQEVTLQTVQRMDQELSTLRSANDQLLDQTRTDALTGVGNRKHFDHELRRRFDQASAFNGSLGVIVLDIDHFKMLNDTLGHPAGDVVLREVAKCLTASIREGEVVARIGGEEFAVLVPGASISDLALVADRIRSAIAACSCDVADMHGDPSSVSVTVSLGVTILNEESAAAATSPELLLKAADRALYAAKDSGRNCVRFYRFPSEATERRAG